MKLSCLKNDPPGFHERHLANALRWLCTFRFYLRRESSQQRDRELQKTENDCKFISYGATNYSRRT